MKEEEKRLFEAVRDRELSGRDFIEPSTLELAEQLAIPIERADAYCRKWSDRGWYSYGMRPLIGRMTKLGMEQ